MKNILFLTTILASTSLWANESKAPKLLPTLSQTSESFNTTYAPRPYASNGKVHISFSRIYMDARPLVTVDPILPIVDSDIESNLLSCLEKQVTLVADAFKKMDSSVKSPTQVYIGVKQFDGLLLESLCRPSVTPVTENHLLLQVCYSPSDEKSELKCQTSSDSQVQFAYRKFKQQVSEKSKVVQSLKDKSSELADLLSKRAK